MYTERARKAKRENAKSIEEWERKKSVQIELSM
jgi:hypothetical protein